MFCPVCGPMIDFATAKTERRQVVPMRKRLLSALASRMFAGAKKFIENNVSLPPRRDTSYLRLNNAFVEGVCCREALAGPGRFSRV